MRRLNYSFTGVRLGLILLIYMGLAACAQPSAPVPAKPAQPSADSDNPLSSLVESGEPPPSSRPEAPSASTTPPPSSSLENYLITVIPNLWESLGEKIVPPAGLELPIAEQYQRGDLWDRIRSGFSLPYYHHPKVLAEAQEYTGSQDYLDHVVRRSRPFLYYVVHEVEKRSIPSEIALVPIIESVYSPGAISANGAAGIWQFIPSTGRHFGLKRDFWYDGRRDVIASTDAALNYLQKLNADFGGDWLITLAAYNAGEGRVRRAIQKNQDAGKPVDFWSLDLPRETATYVPRLLAIAAIVDHPDEFGVSLSSIPDAPYLASVDVDSQINLNVAAQIAGITRDELKRLNPGLLRGATNPKGTTTLLLPADKADKFSARLMSLDSSMRKSHKLAKVPAAKRRARGVRPPAQSGTQGQPQEYSVRKGDTLSAIAQDFNISVEQLRAWNEGKLDGKHITPGLKLNVSQPASAGNYSGVPK